MSDRSNSDFVVVARPGSLMEADMIRAALDAAGIAAVVPGAYATNTLAHMAQGLHPSGMKVLVSAQAADKARAVVEQWYGHQTPEEVADLSCDAWAQRAWRAACVGLVIPFALPYVLCCIVQARRAAQQAGPENETRYRRHLLGAGLLVGLVVLAVVLLAVEAFRP